MRNTKNQVHPPSSESLDAGYEVTTVNVAGLGLFVIVLIVTGAIVLYGCVLLMRHYLHEQVTHDRPYSALTDSHFLRDYDATHRTPLAPAPTMVPNGPLLQPSKENGNRVPPEDLKLMYHREDRVFRQMGWGVDEANPARLDIPQSVIAAVVRDETNRQKQENPNGASGR